MASHLTLAVAQAHTLGSTSQTLAALARTASRAAEAGADLILFPEAYLGGYPRGASFGCAIGARTEEGREQFLRHYQDAVDLGDTPAGGGMDWVRRRIGLEDRDGNSEGKSEVESTGAQRRGDGTREELERIARDSGVFLVTGVIERAGGSLYCAVVYVDPQRGCIGKRRKVMPTGTERLIWAQGSPSTLRAVKTTIKGVEITLAAAVCWENYMPLLRASLYSQGVNIYLAPTADGRDTWLALMRTIAHEGRTFVLSSNQCIRHENLPSWISADAQASSGTAIHEQPNRTSGDPQPLSPRSKAPIKPTDPPSPRAGRRSSIVTRTTENHEITWPTPTLDPKPPATSGRRKSVTVAAGPHEVCLPALSATRTAPATTTTTTTAPRTHPLATEETHPLADRGAPKTQAPTGLASRGGSCIVGPDGKVLAGPLWDDTDALLTVKVDFNDCVRGRLDLDTAGHYSRNDSFELKVRGLDLNPP